jgi:hypothetical protein
LVKTLKRFRKQHNFDPTKTPRRDKFFKKLAANFPTSSPITTHGAHGATKSLSVRSFSFLEQLQDLLVNTDIFEELDSLTVNREESERFKIFKPGPDDKFSAVMAAEWASRTSLKFITNNNREAIIIPIILYADKTGTDAF